MVTRARDAAASRAVSSVLLVPRQRLVRASGRSPGRITTITVNSTLSACEARIERESGRLPTVAIVGASYTAGVGPDNPELSWAVHVARQLRWNAVIYGVPGAGYVRAGTAGRGPMKRMLTAERLARLDPALVIVQAGFDDLGVPAGLEERRVGQTVDMIRDAAPRARIALLTTFAFTAQGSPAVRQTDDAIIAGGTAADPAVIVMNPLAGRWAYPRADGGLHPTAAGDAWIGREVAAILRAHGVSPAPATSAAPLICDVSVGAGKPVTATA